MNGGGGVFGALIFVVGVLVAFAILFGFFLIVPFFIFLAALVVMLVSDRKRSRGDAGPDEAPGAEPVDTSETTTEARKAGS